MKKDKHGNNCDKMVKIHIRTLALTTWDYFKAVEYAEKLYGSNGIYFYIETALCVVLSAADEVKLQVIDGTCKWDQFNTEQNDLYNLTKVGTLGGIVVFIVGGISKPGAKATDAAKPLNGCAGHAPDKPSVVVSASGTMYTMAHEIGHVLLGSSFDPVHTEDNTNIMIGGTELIPKGTSPTFNAAQLTQIKKSPLLKAV